MTLKFLLDEDLSYRVAEGLRARLIDAISIHEIGLANQEIPDEAHLERATEEGRVLVTYNRADFQVLDAQWRLDGRTHAGILWCLEKTLPRRAIGDLIRAIEAASAVYESLDGLCLPLARAG